MVSHNTSPVITPSRVVARRRATARRIGLSALLLCALLIRLLWIEADAATTLTWSGAPFTDEGLYSHAARNQVLFGTWRTNEWDNRLVSPLFDGLAFSVFSVFGVGFVQVRLISIGFTIGALLLFWSMLRRDWGPYWALLGATLWGLDYFWVQYSRLGLLEPGMVAWLVAAAWCWRRALDGTWRWSIGVGICAGIAYVWKSLALLWLPVPLLALLLLGGVWPRRQVALGYLLGLGLVCTAYGLLWYLPRQSELAAYNQFYAADRLPTSITEAWQVLIRNGRSTYVWAQTPIVLVVALLGGLRALPAVWKRSLPPSMALALSWAVCGAALLIMPYSPPRYYTLLLPAVVCLALFATRSTDNLYSHHYTRYAASALLGTCLIWNGWWYAQWARQRGTTLRDSARELQRLVPDGELVIGVAACGLSLGNDLPCAPPFAGLVNDQQPIERLGARYGLVEERSPDDYLRRFYGPLLSRSTRLAQLSIGPRRFTLYRFDNQATADQ
jgi:4-amino-4-deoxy-L-arabinose transferase-like glycosyltransferase